MSFTSAVSVSLMGVSTPSSRPRRLRNPFSESISVRLPLATSCAVDESVSVEPLHLGPFGRGPLAIRVGRMTVAIRRSHARAVKVTIEAA